MDGKKIHVQKRREVTHTSLPSSDSFPLFPCPDNDAAYGAGKAAWRQPIAVDKEKQEPQIFWLMFCQHILNPFTIPFHLIGCT